MSTPELPDQPSPPELTHLRTIGHEGRLWDVYLELVQDPRYADSARGRIAFSPAGVEEEPSLRTAVVIIERNRPEAVSRARGLDEHHLISLLRSLLPE